MPTPGTTWLALGPAVLFAAMQLHAPPANGGTDVVRFGGSRMVGEVKRLSRGKLYFKTDSTDTITIDWADVTELVTDQRLHVERRDGRFSASTLVAGAPERSLTLQAQNEDFETLSMQDVVAFEPLEPTFWDRLDITASMGYSFTDSTDIEQFNFDATVEYRTEERSRRLSLYVDRSDTGSNDSSTRRGIEYDTIRFRQATPYFTGWQYSYEDNDALALDYRLLLGATAGREFYPSPFQRLRPFTGIALVREQYSDSGEENVEMLLGTLFDWYRFSSPEIDLSSSFVVYPSLTDLGRVRSRVDISLRWELVDDLYWQLSFFDDHDSDPPPESSSKGDYGINTGLGWSW